MRASWFARTLWIAACSLVAMGAAAQPRKEVTFAHQDMNVPFRTVMESGELEKTTGYKINWRMFGGGGDVIRAMSSGDVQIGEAGSSPIAAAASQGLDVELVWVLDDIADAEALVARNGSGVNSVADLKGKRVGVPFVSTTHYHLLFALQRAGVDPKSVDIRNMRPPEIGAAWERGDIDATFVWDPVLSRVKGNGKVIVTSGELTKAGRPTFDGIIVSRKFAREHPEFMVALINALAKADADYRQNQAKWTVDSPQVKAVAKWTKADPKDVPAAMKLYKFPTLQEQASPAWLGGGKDGGAAKALADTSAFLKEQGRVQAVAADYSQFVNPTFVQKAMGK
ncbi:MAG TPA: taurine ABC transporter substrate-binding protein [Burkholderiaceae bacterium]|nr:taurine ABC transporter substrate-binding protein [Burkholderiaceae bacterium]